MTPEGKLVLLGRFYDNVQAHIIRGILESHDVPCFIMDEHHNNAAWHLGIALGGVRLMVFAQDYERAQEILKEEMQHYKAATPERAPLLRRPYLKTLLGTLVGFFAGAPSIRNFRKREK
ncbi:MAG: DUF2007 domain-containing protein [Alphaproteobacteria bacterium]